MYRLVFDYYRIVSRERKRSDRIRTSTRFVSAFRPAGNDLCLITKKLHAPQKNLRSSIVKRGFFFQSWLPYLLLSYYILLLIHKRRLISIDLPRSYLRSSYTIATFFILSDWKKRITLASTRKIFSGRNRP